MMTAEQQQDCGSVWAEMAVLHPEFTRGHDPTNNWHQVRELILGGSLSWRDANERFKPFPGSKVMDLGANVGIFTAHCVLHGANVDAYEADPQTFAILAKMAEDTCLPSCLLRLHNKAVWTFTGEMQFASRVNNPDSDGFLQRNGNLIIREHESSKQIVPCISFDDAIGDAEWDCVKFDIEGAEFEILLTSQRLQQIKFINVELHPDGISQSLYNAVIAKLEAVFKFEGIANPDTGRFQTACLTRL